MKMLSPCRGCTSFWITFSYFCILLQVASSSHIPDYQCDSDCQLSVVDESLTYRRFMNIIKPSSTRVVYFYLYKEHSNESLHEPPREAGIFYAWVRHGSGQAIFTLPSDYITTTLSLYRIFAASFRINVTESTQNCYYDTVNNTCRALIIFNTISKWIEVNANKNSSAALGSICRRQFMLSTVNALGDINYSCCEEGESNSSKIDYDQCLHPKNVGWFAPIMRIFTIILSISLGGMSLSKAINMYLETFEK